MTTRPDETVARVREWAAYADEDLRIAEHAFSTPGGPPYRLVAYHAQQCAEKYLKAYLTLRGVDFPYTHNIARLLELCAEHANWPRTLVDAEELTPFAITTRYPGVDEPVSESEARRAFTVAGEVREAIRQALAGEGVSL